jgi:hypothetical protein
MFFATYYFIYYLDMEVGAYIVIFSAREVRTNQRCDAGARNGGGQLGSNARVRHSLDVDQRS